MDKVEPIEWMSEVIEFTGDERESPEVSDSRILFPLHYARNARVFWQPPIPFIIRECEIVNGPPNAEMTLDIAYVQVANVMLTAFTKRHPVCVVGYRIQVEVEYRGKAPCHCQVRIRGDGLVQDNSRLGPEAGR